MDAVRGDVRTPRRRAAPAEQVAGLDVTAPAREVGGEVVAEAVLTGAGVGGARQDEQEGCQDWQEAEVWHSASIQPEAVPCLSRSVPNVSRAGRPYVIPAGATCRRR